MRNVYPCLMAWLALGFASAARAELAEMPAGIYGLDKGHGYISFSYSHLGFSNPILGFNEFDVTLKLDNQVPESSQVAVLIDAASISTRVTRFDEELRGQDYFDTENHPVISFISKRIERSGDNTFRVAGELTIKDVTRPLVLDTTINKAAKHPMRGVPTIGVSATSRIKRSDWGLSRALPHVGDLVTLHIEVELPRQRSD